MSVRRDPRLDFYRGLAMFIILLAHTPKNWWAGWIPARFGFSDATEIFVFCSGMASAIAFGGTFRRAGWWSGCARTMLRVWQVYWAHIGLFFFIAMGLAFLDGLGISEKNYVSSLNLTRFFKDTQTNIIGLFSLTYVPNYFDILPMYLVILAMLPFVMLLERVGGRWAVFAFVLGLWGIANFGLLPLPAEPWSHRQWFFNPFGWQVIFFTGFAFMFGWLPKPPVNRWLVAAALAFIVISLPLASWKVISWIGAFSPDMKSLLQETRSGLRDFYHKTEQGPLRYAHFMALAYLGYAAAGEGGKRLIVTGRDWAALVGAWIVRMVTKVGQQSLAVFVFSMALARLIGFVLDEIGRTWATVSAANCFGFAMLVFVAYGAAYFRAQPWRKKV